jgi:surface antigen
MLEDWIHTRRAGMDYQSHSAAPTTGARQTRRRTFSGLALIAILCLAQAPVWADPPPWAPAHGWRKKHDPYYQGYTGRQWDRDYGIAAGRCDRQAVGAVVGGVLGAAVGSQIGRGADQQIAILLGTAIGAVVGSRVAEGMTNADAACIGHALELAGDGRVVTWADDRGTQYRVKPLRGYTRDGLACRRFQLTAGGRTVEQGACQREPGTWEIR